MILTRGLYSSLSEPCRIRYWSLILDTKLRTHDSRRELATGEWYLGNVQIVYAVLWLCWLLLRLLLGWSFREDLGPR